MIHIGLGRPRAFGLILIIEAALSHPTMFPLRPLLRQSRAPSPCAIICVIVCLGFADTILLCDVSRDTDSRAVVASNGVGEGVGTVDSAITDRRLPCLIISGCY